jgi:hypothetical protein
MIQMLTDEEVFYAHIRNAQWWCGWHLMWGCIGMYYYMESVGIISSSEAQVKPVRNR